MGRPCKPTPDKFCIGCGARIDRKRFSNGVMQSLSEFDRAKFCASCRLGTNGFLLRFWEKVQIGSADECWLWTGARLKSQGGREAYGHVNINGSSFTAHVIAWELSTGEQLPVGMIGCHACDNPPCCNPAHVFPGTHADNSRDMVQKNRHSRTATFGNRKLSDVQVEAIRAQVARLRRGEKQRTFESLGEVFGVSARAIRKIASGESWKLGEVKE